MGELRVRISDVAHGKLNMLKTIYKKTQDEIIEWLILKAPLPKLAWDFIIADEAGVKTEKTEINLEKLERKVEIKDAEEIEKMR